MTDTIRPYAPAPKPPMRVIDPTARARVLQRDHHACRVCGSRSGVQVHHVKTKGSGGGDTDDNLLTLCAQCHTDVHAGRVKVRRSNPGDTRVMPDADDTLELDPPNGKPLFPRRRVGDVIPASEPAIELDDDPVPVTLDAAFPEGGDDHGNV